MLVYLFSIILFWPLFTFLLCKQDFDKGAKIDYTAFTVIGLCMACIWPVTLPVFTVRSAIKALFDYMKRKRDNARYRQNSGQGINL